MALLTFGVAISYRRAVPADAAALAALATRTFTDTYAAHNTADDMRAYLDATYGVAHQTRELTDPTWITVLAESPAGPIGFAQVRRSTPPPCVREESPVEVYRFYVDRAAHGTGVAARLMTEAIAAARDLGGRHAWLGVWEHNARAIAFYRKCGFTDVGTQQFRLGADVQTDRVVVRPAKLSPPREVRTDRLLLRCWRPADAPLLKDAIDSSLEHLRRWMPWAMSEPSSIETIEERLAMFAANFDAGREWVYGILSADEGMVIGGTGLHPRLGPSGLEIGYWIRESHTRRGFARDAAAALTQTALALPAIDHVEIRCDPANAGSAAIPKRLGYTLIDTIREEGMAPGGGPRDAMIWRMRR